MMQHGLSFVLSRFRLLPVALLVSTFVVLFVISVHGQQRTAADGVYTETQAARGQTVYEDRCASCHSATLGGAQGPPLAGEAFLQNWGGPLCTMSQAAPSLLESAG